MIDAVNKAGCGIAVHSVVRRITDRGPGRAVTEIKPAAERTPEVQVIAAGSQVQILNFRVVSELLRKRIAGNPVVFIHSRQRNYCCGSGRAGHRS